MRQLLANGQIRIDGGTPEELADFMRKEAERWGPVIKAMGVRLD